MYEQINQTCEPADIVIYLQDKGLVLKEKSLVAYERSTGKIVAFGTEAEHMEMVPQGDLVICSPLRQGAVADYTTASRLFTGLLQRALGKKPVMRPRIAICVPPNLSEVEKRALEDAVHEAGAREIWIADIPVDQFIREAPKKSPQLYKKFKIIIGITKDDPERYVRERLSEALAYANQAGISRARVADLLKSVD